MFFYFALKFNFTKRKKSKMKIIHLDKKKKEIKLKTESLDDLWYLSQFIDPGDLVSGKTLRKIKHTKSSDERNANVERRWVYIKINVEKIEFHETTSTLRVLGTIADGPEDVSRGSHHTFNISDDTTITIEKKELMKYHFDILEKAASNNKNNVLIVVFDREECTFAKLKHQGYEILSEIKGNVQKKADLQNIKSNFYAEIINKIKEYDSRYNLDTIIIGSTSIWNDYLLKELYDDNLKKKIFFTTANNVGKNGINEVLKREDTKKRLKENRTLYEISLVETLLENISKNTNYAYGFDEVKKSAFSGAVDKLLITDTFIRRKKEEGLYSEIEEIMKLTESANGEIHIISSHNEGGKKLDGIGGIGAILRYSLN